MGKLPEYPSDWIEVYPELLAPRLLLVYYFVKNPSFAPRVRPPGTTLTLVVDGVMEFRCPSGCEGKARRGDMVCFYPGITEYAVADAVIAYELHNKFSELFTENEPEYSEAYGFLRSLIYPLTRQISNGVPFDVNFHNGLIGKWSSDLETAATLKKPING